MAQDPHPVAGAKGTGRPIAPPEWKWRCGQRIRDMYFYSPEGKVIRSRTELAAFLDTMPSAPSPDEFCWRVTDEVIKTGVWTKDESSHKPRKPSTPNPRNPSTPKPPKSTPAKHKPEKVEPATSKKRAKTDSGSSPSVAPQIPNVSTASNGIQFSQVQPLAIRAPGSVVSKKVTSLTSRAKAKTKKDTSNNTSGPSPASHTFREILSVPSSFKWLYDSETRDRFLSEARKLGDLSAEEVSELRKLLVGRNMQMGNITKYPNPVLRVFVRLLGSDGLGEEPANSLGKVELADICMKLAKT